MRRNFIAFFFMLVIALPDICRGETEFREIKLESGARLRYAVVFPPKFKSEPAVPYPVLLALPQGKQDEEMVELGLNMYWESEAQARGWIAVSPMTPDERFFYDAPPEWIPMVMDEVEKSINLEGGKFHLAGVGNGGLAAFHIALRHPERFQTLMVLPGFIRSTEDQAKAAVLKGIRVRIYVGDRDYAWLPLVRRCADALMAAGVETKLEVIAEEGHMLRIKPTKLFTALDGMRIRIIADQEKHATRAPNDPIGAVLDDFHDAAAKGDGKRYFNHLSAQAVFLGTDGTERWTKENFQKWASDHGYMNGKGWVYTARKRNVTMSPDGKVAWFDEVLANEKYGECRGSGVLIRDDQEGKFRWLITQYNLTIPIPNDVTDEVVSKIRAFGSGPGKH